MERRLTRSRRGAVLVWGLLSLLAWTPAAVAQDAVPLGPEPVFLRADLVGRIPREHATGTLLLHAGGEPLTQVVIQGPEQDPSGAVEARSTRAWQPVSYEVPLSGGEVRVVSEGGVWVVALSGVVHRAPSVTFGCGGLGVPFFWDVVAEEVRLQRSGPEAPVVVLFRPNVQPPVPDASGVEDHTMLLGPREVPLYLKPVALGDDCNGTTTLEVGRGPDGGPLDAGLRMLLWLLAGIGLVVAVAGYGVWLMARDREHHPRIFRERGRL